MTAECDMNKNRNEEEIKHNVISLRSFPRSLIVSLTSECNIRCKMCSVWENPWHISSRTEREISDLIPGLEKITWQGGEVFLSPAFEPLFKKAREVERMHQCIVTNGLLIDERWADILTEGNNLIVFSIDAVRKEMYEGIRRGASFEKLASNLQRLAVLRERKNRKDKVQFKMQMVLMEENRGEIEAVPEFLKRFGFDQLQIMPLCDWWKDPSLYTDKDKKESIERDFSRVYEQMEREGVRVYSLLPFKKKSVRKKGSSQEPRRINQEKCRWPWQQLSIGLGGNVAPCGLCRDLILGNTDSSSILSIWNDKPMQQIRREIIDNRLCSFCPGHADDLMIPADKYGLDKNSDD